MAKESAVEASPVARLRRAERTMPGIAASAAKGAVVSRVPPSAGR